MSLEISFLPLDDRGPGILDAMEARMGRLPYSVNVEDGSRRYNLHEDSAVMDAFDTVLDEIDSAWRDHLSRTE
jgi:hypothetical protein